MNSADRANQFLCDAVSDAMEGRGVTIVSHGRGARAAALLAMAASAMGVTDAYAGALHRGSVLVEDAARVMQDGMRIDHSIDSIGRNSSHGRYVDVIRQGGRIMRTMSKYEPESTPQPVQSQTAPSITRDRGVVAPRGTRSNDPTFEGP